MNIVHVLWGLSCGGIENMLVDIVNEQVKHEKVSILVINDDVSDIIVNAIDNDVQVVFLGRKAGSINPIFLIKLYAYILSIMPDVIHLHAPDISKFVFLHRIIKAKLFCTAHTVNKALQDFDGFDKFDKMFAISHAVRDSLINSRGIDSVVVHNGVNPDKIESRERTIYNQKEVFRIVQIGRLVESEKGQDILIKAINELVHSYGLLNIVVEFIGEGSSEGRFKQLVKEYALEAHCHFLGSKQRDYVYERLQKYDLLIQPSRFEGFGLTIVEAMAARVPVIASNVDGPAEVIDDEIYGFLFESESVSSLAEKIYSVIESYNSASTQNIIHLAYDNVCRNYNIVKTSNKYIEEYCR